MGSVAVASVKSCWICWTKLAHLLALWRLAGAQIDQQAKASASRHVVALLGAMVLVDLDEQEVVLPGRPVLVHLVDQHVHLEAKLALLQSSHPLVSPGTLVVGDFLEGGLTGHVHHPLVCVSLDQV